MFDDSEPPDGMQRGLQQVERRRDPRRPCFIPVTYKTSNRVFADYVRNISMGGAFIETAEACMPGEDVAMMFSFPHRDMPIRTKGTVMWKGPQGVGVQFTTPCHELQKMVDSHWSVRMKAFL